MQTKVPVGNHYWETIYTISFTIILAHRTTIHTSSSQLCYCEWIISLYCTALKSSYTSVQLEWPHCFHAPTIESTATEQLRYSSSQRFHCTIFSVGWRRPSRRHHRNHHDFAVPWPIHYQITDIKLSSTYRAYSYTIVIIITQLYENVSSVIDHPRQHHAAVYDNNGDLGAGVSVDNVSLATTIIDAALNYTALTSSAAAAATGDGVGNNDTHTTIPEIPAYIRTTSMVFCITIMFLGVIGNIMVSLDNL